MPRKHKETEAEAPVIPELEELPPRRRAFVQNYANPESPTFGNATRSWVATGAPDTPAAGVTASRDVLGNPKVQSALSAVWDAVGATELAAASVMWGYATDSDSKVRSASVRAGEIVLRSRGMLESEAATAQVAVILPQLDAASLRAALRATDGEGNEVAGG